VQPPATQAPFEQTSAFAHFFPHAPQLSRSTVTSVQSPLQSCSLARQPHLPWMQVVPPMHAVPHAPQLVSSLFKSTQELLQFVSPGAQPAAHAPLLQTAIVLVQVAPHAPQFLGSFERSTQAPPHRAVPAGHEHWPLPHCSLAAHAVVQLPQWAGSLVVSTHD
jgi:hypothetical protein